MYPLKFAPVYQERIWGGQGLKEKFGRQLPAKPIGESWEISAHPNGLGSVVKGNLAGYTIPELIAEFGVAFLGFKAESSCREKFPLLVKLLDAKEQLSVQVHPDNSFALEKEGELGKFEIWYILAAAPGAKIVYGLKPGIDAAALQRAIQNGNVESCLNEVVVKKGELYVIPPGLVHGLGAGIMVAEIQQNSDIVYRVYDYNRLDDHGKLRELHVDKALEVIRFDDFLPSYPLECQENSRVIETEHFQVDLVTNREREEFFNEAGRFYILTCLQGNANIYYHNEKLPWIEGESILIPADVSDFIIEGEAKYLRTYLL